MALAGGHSETSEATPEIQELVKQIRPTVEVQLGQTFDIFEATHYRQQVVAGMIYHVRVKTSAKEDCVHLRIFLPLPHTGERLQLQKAKTAAMNDELNVM
uniref:Cystatin domain-containing protein n=1 Tax=Attheya septentrionalis TaxID=420275 RepID=A0A6T7FJ01_9STRA|mmetsp:Transcript_14137/g.25605  ORF Transcript_14137/g.25605 Transcript_14137/m.25605 type:complete len:100 (+) Transcript_14137:167-466(+)